MRRLLAGLVLLAGCSVPPPDAYTAASGRPEQAVDLGINTVGESCIQGASATVAADIYCGTWQQPSARVHSAGPASEASLASFATSGLWRRTLDGSYECQAPQAVALPVPALRLDCARRLGGWPHVALVELAGGQAWLADGVPSAVPAIETSIAILSGRQAGARVNSAALDALQAGRQGARARSTGDVREFDSLMTQGARANLADNPIAAESAYGAALALQEKALGSNNPNIADPQMHLALQFSNEGRFPEADALFQKAEALAARQQVDRTLLPRLYHYEGLNAVNQGKKEEALAFLHKADAAYVASLDPAALRPPPTVRPGLDRNLGDTLGNTVQAQTQVALSGLVETRRYQSVVLRELGRIAESNAALASAAVVARNAGIERPELTARLLRTTAVNASLSGDRSGALADFHDSSTAFARAYPGSRPFALVSLLEARELVESGRAGAAISACRSSMAILLKIKSAFGPERMTPCLDAFAKTAAATGDAGARQALLVDMFQAAQLVRSSSTSMQIQQAAARLSEGRSDSRVSGAIRAEQDAAVHLADVQHRRQEAAGAAKADEVRIKALEEEEKAAIATLADSESTLQAAAPNYDQLIQQAASAAEVLRLLKPGEAFASITMTPSGGWTFLLRDGQVQVGAIPGGAGAVDPLVGRIRASMEPSTPRFDIAAARGLYSTLFGGLGGGMDGVKALTVAPMGRLLSLPFGVLLTGDANPGALGEAPWLLRRMAIAHVPSAGNFAALRRTGGSKASQPWFGFGDFRPVTLAQARKTFPGDCGESAELLAHLPPLPGAKKELDAARALLGGTGPDALLGAAFTAQAVEKEDLSDYRVLHFATHAILPAELTCQSEPALVTSAPAGAADASGALLKASDLARIKLDADLVILSACNSGGADGRTSAGESLSTLARSFFFGGARALLVTHWDVNDAAATFLVADTLKQDSASPGLGLAGALRAAQLDMLGRAGTSIPAAFAHPYYWAPFALIGQASAAGLQSAGGL